jgi:hypothetical protein
MKRHFTNASLVTLLAAAFLACCGAAVAKSPVHKPKAAATAPPATASLQLIIEGPFILCERANGLEIALPKLKDNHYPSGLGAENSSLSLDYDWQPAKFNLALPHAGAGGMKLVYDRNGVAGDTTGGGLATLYRENRTCIDPLPNAAISILVPKPDEILPLSDGVHLSTVWDQKPNPPGTPLGTRQGRCNPGPCKHANKVKLLYSKTTLSMVKLTCLSGACSSTPSWPPPGAFVPFPIAELHLDVHPMPPVKLATGGWQVPTSISSACQAIQYDIGDPHTTATAPQAMDEEEAEAFCTATAMVLPQTTPQARYLLAVPGTQTPRAMNHKVVPADVEAQDSIMTATSAVDHRDCIVPPALFCTSAACASASK